MATPPQKSIKLATHEDVRSLELQISDVEDAIRKVEGETAKVVKALDNARTAWDEDEDLRAEFEHVKHYRRALRKEKEQLQKEEQLRKEKEQLRDLKILEVKADKGRKGLRALSGEEKAFFDALENMSLSETVLTLPSGVQWLGQSRRSSQSIFIRPCYKKLYEMMEKKLQTENNVILTGTPGIGKSYFALYWLFLAVKNQRTVLYEEGPKSSRNCYLWSRGEQLVSEAEENPCLEFSGYLKDPKVLHLVDSRRNPRSNMNCQTIVFSSPREENFHDFWKLGAVMFFMPLWSLDELEECRGRIYEDKLPQVYMTTAIGMFGRVPRYALQFAAREVEEGTWEEESARSGEVPHAMSLRLVNAMKEMSESSLRSLLLFQGLEVSDSAGGVPSRQILHLDTVDFERQVHVFASKHVRERLTDSFEKFLDAKADEMLALGEKNVMFGSVAGLIFERLVHRTFASGSMNGKARLLSCGHGEEQYVTLAFSKENVKATKVFGRHEDVGQLDTKTYYRPKALNYPSIDSLIIVDDALYLIQITVASHHGVLMNEVERIVSKAGCARNFLLFVTKEAQAASFKEQRWMTMKGKRAVRIPQALRNVTQIVVGMDL